jgi:hypothetical protein
MKEPEREQPVCGRRTRESRAGDVWERKIFKQGAVAKCVKCQQEPETGPLASAEFRSLII